MWQCIPSSQSVNGYSRSACTLERWMESPAIQALLRISIMLRLFPKGLMALLGLLIVGEVAIVLSDYIGPMVDMSLPGNSIN